MLDAVLEHLQNAVCDDVLLIRVEDVEDLPEDLCKQDVRNGLVVMVSRVDADDL